MTDITQKKVGFPLDDDNYLRRECPYCRREFKILKDDFEQLDGENNYWCPYCGQEALANQWWTIEQLQLINKVTTNIANELINEQLIRPLKKLESRSSSIHITTHELGRENELINPERNDMIIFSLPCCSKSLKIEESWKDSIYCYYCGFRHHPQKPGES